MFSKLIVTGSYLPEKIITNNELSEKIDTSDEWIKSRTGISTRHIAHPSQLTSDLAVEAAMSALNKGNIKPEDIDGIIVATTTPDLTFPATAAIVQNKLGIKSGFAFDIQAVCSGFIYALSVADSMIISKKANRILVIGAETFSRIIDWTDRNTCVLFGDGAGAVILEATNKDPRVDNNSGILGVEIFTDGTYVDCLKTTGGISLNQETGFVCMNGGEVFKHAVNNLVSAAEIILAKHNLTHKDINWLVPHQANLRIITMIAKKLELDMSKVIVTIDKHANTSAASIPIALDFAFKSNKIKAGDIIITESMGGGFTWGSALIRV